MRPEMSLVFLTVFAGMGQGLFMITVLMDLFFMINGSVLPGPFLYSACAVSIAFPAAGMAAGFFHLGKPQRGWKAMMKWKNSWLSREVLFLPAFLGLDALYALLFYMGIPSHYRIGAGLVGAAAALGLYVSSAMLYAAIRFIREWANALTVANFILFGLTSGAAAAAAIRAATGTGTGTHLIALFISLAVISTAMKAASYWHNGAIYQEISVNNALGVLGKNVKLMDTGAAYPHFNTIEYFSDDNASRGPYMKTAAIFLSFVLPLLMGLASIGLDGGVKVALLSAGAVLSLMGLILERRLFFTEANHLQNLYYGNFRKSGAANPLLRKELTAG